MTEWVSLEDAAELEQVEYRAMLERVRKNKYKSRSEPREHGGRDLVYVDVKSLSDEAQKRYKWRREYEARQERAESCEEPWYVGLKLNSYLHKYEKDFLEKTALRVGIEKYLTQIAEIPRGQGTEFTKKYAAELGIGYKQLRRYLNRYDEAIYYAERDNAEYYKTLALCPRPQKGKGMKLTDEMRIMLQNLWASPMYHQNHQPFIALYEDFCAELMRCRAECDEATDRKGQPCRQTDEVYIPSYQTCKRYIDSLEYGRSDVKTLLADGYQGWRNQKMIKGLRDIKSLKVMELIMGDAHTFDCWVSVEKNGKVTAVRPYLVGFVDARSKVIVGWGICTCPNTEIIKNVLINMMYPKKDSFVEGVPRVVYIDNGKDFTSQELTGRKRTERFDIDRDIKGFYKSVGIEYDKRALPYTPWTKAQIERFFGGLCNRFSKRFDSYTGTLTGTRTDGKRAKDIDGMLRRRELPDIEAFASMFEVYLEQYHDKIHSTLKADGEDNPTPRGVWESAERYYKPAPPLDYALSLLGKSCERKVTVIGVKLDNNIYAHELLGGYIGETVIVRYMPGLSDVGIYRRDTGACICVASPAELLNPLAEREDVRLNEHIRAQRRQLRRNRDDIRRLSEPFADRQLQLPELNGEQPKTVSIPEDKEYRAEKADEGRRKKREGAESKFINDLADSVWEALG